MDPRYMVKKWVGKIKGAWCWFNVFTTGAPGWLLFCVLDDHGCDTTIHFPIKKSDLKPAVRKALGAGAY